MRVLAAQQVAGSLKEQERGCCHAAPLRFRCGCCVMQDGAGAVRALAAQQVAGSSKEQEDYVMQCTGCDDRPAAALALQAARGNVDQVTGSHTSSQLRASELVGGC